jgi:hypothetical protein
MSERDYARELNLIIPVPAPGDRRIAWDREETEPCEAGTPGCCIDHMQDKGEGCDTW